MLGVTTWLRDCVVVAEDVEEGVRPCEDDCVDVDVPAALRVPDWVGLPVGEGEDVGDGVESCDLDEVGDKDAACDGEPVAVGDWLWLGVDLWLPLDVTDAVVTWLDVTLGETLGVGVTVSTIEIVCDGVADPVTLGV